MADDFRNVNYTASGAQAIADSFANQVAYCRANGAPITGRICAALDVVCCEPLDPESELAGLPNLIYSPHIGGPTGDRLLRCGRLALENLDRYRRGLPLEAEVTLTTYDRST